jgi:CRISPR-associated endonuclease/helicase Cas3
MTTTPPPLHIDEFARFFRAVHAQDPFPWQQRLCRQVAEKGWPGVLDLPTGAGKTAALDIALFTLALDAGTIPRTAPLRIVYVVDRRTIVDQAHQRARRIQEALSSVDDDVVRRVTHRLAAMTSHGVPLHTALMRGGIARDDMWARTPDQPLIAVSTVDQAGSRLLFRGYGLSDEMKPVHAGLLGCDVLYLLDEVHLSQPFRETLAAIAGRYREWAERPLRIPFAVVEMSATPGASARAAFHLDDSDRANPHLSARLRSSKSAVLAAVSGKGFAKEIEKHALRMLERPGATVALVVNRVKSARELHDHLSSTLRHRPIDVHLLTGRMRPFDRDADEKNLFKRICAGRLRSAEDRAVVIVATQSIEAGADFDFDGLISECASLDALRQRFGRLDRLGQLGGTAEAVIVARTDTLKDDPVYGDAIGVTWEWLRSIAADGSVDFGLEALPVPDDAEERGLLAPKPQAPILLPSHLDAWVQTSPVPEPDPDVALWLHGPERGLADVQVVWRADLTGDLLDAAAGDAEHAAAAVRVALSLVDAIPPVAAEAMPVPFLAAKRWLAGQPEPDSFDVEGARTDEQEGNDARPERPAWNAVRWRGDSSTVITAAELRPGDTIVVPSSYGGIAHGNWSPTATAPVKDVAELAALRQGRRPALRLHDAVVSQLLGADIDAPSPVAGSEALNDRDIAIEWVAATRERVRDEDARDLLAQFKGPARSLRIERLPKGAGPDDGEYLLVLGARRAGGLKECGASDEQVSTDTSLSSFTGIQVTLAEHLSGVASIASGFAQRVGLSAEIVEDLHLGGLWHDAGKADPRFQRWLHGGSEFKALVQAAPLAKAATRVIGRTALHTARERAGYPGGTRHELMSLVLMDAAGVDVADAAHDWPLVQHLVATHHGRCRPLAPWTADPNPVTVRFSHNGSACEATSAHDLARLDSGVAERFWVLVRRYGWWGLAWLEAMLRLGDHRQSELEQTHGGHPSA